MGTDFRDLHTARQLAAGVAAASMSGAFQSAVLAGKRDDSPAVQNIIEALRAAREEGAKSND